MNTPIVMWTGETLDPRDDDVDRSSWDRKRVQARVVVIKNPAYSPRGKNPEYNLVFEIEDGTDALKVQRWRPHEKPFPEFLSDVGEKFLKKGEQP